MTRVAVASKSLGRNGLSCGIPFLAVGASPGFSRAKRGRPGLPPTAGRESTRLSSAQTEQAPDAHLMHIRGFDLVLIFSRRSYDAEAFIRLASIAGAAGILTFQARPVFDIAQITQ